MTTERSAVYDSFGLLLEEQRWRGQLDCAPRPRRPVGGGCHLGVTGEILLSVSYSLACKQACPMNSVTTLHHDSRGEVPTPRERAPHLETWQSAKLPVSQRGSRYEMSEVSVRNCVLGSRLKACARHCDAADMATRASGSVSSSGGAGIPVSNQIRRRVEGNKMSSER